MDAMTEADLQPTPEDEKIDVFEDYGISNPDPRHSIGELIEARYGRRALFGAGVAATALAMLPQDAAAQGVPLTGGPSTLGFQELRHQLSQGDSVAEGYEAQTVIRWGDPILADGPDFQAGRSTPDSQAKQFGYNNDYLDFFPLPQGSNAADHGLLAVNHEYTNTNLMWPGLGAGRVRRAARQRRAGADGGARARHVDRRDPQGRRALGLCEGKPLQPPRHRADADARLRSRGRT